MLKSTAAFGACIVTLLGSGSVIAEDTFQALVNGNTLTWGNDTFGYLQVQDAQTWQTLCENQVFTLEDTPSGTRDDTACVVTPGVYNILNHFTRQRINGLVIGDLDGSYTAPDVETIDGVWVRYDPYLIIDASTVFEAFASVAAPADLYALVYSPTAAELFWNRAAEPGLQYDVRREGTLLGSTDGTSLFLNNLQPGKSIQLDVVARNSAGALSALSSVSLQTPNDGNGSSGPSELMTPSGLRASLYSANTLELFWDRQGPGQQFEVLNDNGDVLTRTDGTSYFMTNLPLSNEYVFEVVAIDVEGNRSVPADIVVRTSNPDDEPAITIDNAEVLLKQVVFFANRDPFLNVERLIAPGVNAVLGASLQFIIDNVTSSNGLTLIDGTGGGPDTVNFAGQDGGQYTCNAGGAAAGLSVLGGETGQGYIVSLDHCMLPAASYTGRVSSIPGGRSGYDANSYSEVEVIPNSSTTSYLYDSSYRFEVPFRNSGQTDNRMSVSNYAEKIAGSDDGRRVFNYESFITNRVGLAFDDDPDTIGRVPLRDSKASITFSIELPAISSARFEVVIDLKYFGDVDAVDPIDLWNAGSIIITAADGSKLTASPTDADADTAFESVTIKVGDEEILRSLSDGYLVSCRHGLLEECNIQTEQ